MGDLNTKIKLVDNEMIAYSSNGKMLKELVTDCNLYVANFHEKTIGKWTRIQESKKSPTRSVLNYILLDEHIYSQFGVLPIMYEIQLNQLMFLHHIIHLQDDDPMKTVFDSMTFFPEENNWWLVASS